MLMQTGCIQTSHWVTRPLAWDPTCFLLSPSFPIKIKQNIKVLKSRRQYNLYLENYPAFKWLNFVPREQSSICQNVFKDQISQMCQNMSKNLQVNSFIPKWTDGPFKYCNLNHPNILFGGFFYQFCWRSKKMFTFSNKMRLWSEGSSGSGLFKNYDIGSLQRATRLKGIS